MSLVDFYKIVAVTKASVKFVRIGVESTISGYLSGTKVPAPGTRIDGIIYTRRYKKYVDSYAFNGHISSARAFKWNGKPMYFNHCDRLLTVY